MGLVLTGNAGASVPVTLAQAKDRLRETTTDRDEAIQLELDAAIELVQGHSGYALKLSQWALTLSAFADSIELPFPPLKAVTNIQYKDADGNTQTLDASAYIVDATALFPVITRAPGAAWPDTATHPAAVTINYVSGFDATTSAVPAALKAAVLVMVEHLDAGGEATVEPPQYRNFVNLRRVQRQIV